MYDPSSFRLDGALALVTGGGAGITPEMQERMMPPDNLIGHPGRPQDIANAMLWLCSRAGGWISGQTINVHGGGNVVRLFGE